MPCASRPSRPYASSSGRWTWSSIRWRAASGAGRWHPGALRAQDHGQPFSGWGLDLEHDALVQQSLAPATPEEIRDTVTVMGGEDWQLWMQALQQADCLAPGANRGLFLHRPRIHLSPYRDGTIGYAKEHLHATAETINLQLAEVGGHAWCRSARRW